MHRRLWFSVAMLAAGASLLVAASFASASGASPSIKKGGTLKIGTTGNLDSVDPQIAYGTTSWWFEFATRANLYTYPDKAGAAGGKLIPEVAKGFTVSKNGRVYTFHLKKNYRFSDGKKVTAASFAYAIKRSRNKAPQLAGRRVHHRLERGQHRQRQGAWPHAQDHREAGGSEPDHDPGDAVLPGDVVEAPAHEGGHHGQEGRRPPDRGPLHLVVQRSEQPGEHRSQQVLPRVSQALHRWCVDRHEPQHQHLLQPDEG